MLANNAYPIPQHIVEKCGEGWAEIGNIVTNGPFKLETWQKGRSMVLVRNPYYLGSFTGNVERVELSLFPSTEWSDSLASYEADDLDILMGLPPVEMDRVRQRYAEQYITKPWLLTHYIAFNINQPPFNDIRIRRAFVQAKDLETLADVTLRGDVFPGTGGFITPGMPGHSPGIGLRYNPDRARQLLAEAGYPNGRGFPIVEVLSRPRSRACD